MHSHGKIKALFLFSAVVLATGINGQCNGLPLPGAADCGSVGVPSVAVTVTDPGGMTLPAATIAFGVNGGPPSLISCSGNCDAFPIAFNAVGRFDMTATAPGFMSEMRRVTVTSQDGCRPDTVNLTIALSPDDTIAALAGVWETNNIFGRSILRFGDSGQIIGAILFDRSIAGDGNFYVSFNNRQIRGVPGQLVAFVFTTEPTRTGDRFTFLAQALGFPVGFQDATMSSDFMALVGSLPGLPPGTPAVYTRLADIPEPLQTP